MEIPDIHNLNPEIELDALGLSASEIADIGVPREVTGLGMFVLRRGLIDGKPRPQDSDGAFDDEVVSSTLEDWKVMPEYRAGLRAAEKLAQKEAQRRAAERGMVV